MTYGQENMEQFHKSVTENLLPPEVGIGYRSILKVIIIHLNHLSNCQNILR